MKALIGTGILVLLGVAMAATNPNQAQYNQFAAQKTAAFIQSDICEAPIDIPDVLKSFLRGGCSAWANSSQSSIANYIDQNTERRNFLLFSLYTTTLPTHQIKAVGIFEQFYLYNVSRLSRTGNSSLLLP